MIYILTTLLVIGVSLFILSFFMNNRFNDLEQDLEQLSMTHIQDQYVLKNKIKVLEEELLTETMDSNYSSKEQQPNDMMNNQKSSQTNHNEPAIVVKVKKLYDQGYQPKEIETQTGLAEDDIKIIIHQKTNNQVFA